MSYVVGILAAHLIRTKSRKNLSAGNVRTAHVQMTLRTRIVMYKNCSVISRLICKVIKY